MLTFELIVSSWQCWHLVGLSHSTYRQEIMAVLCLHVCFSAPRSYLRINLQEVATSDNRCYDNRYHVVAIVTVAVLKQSLLCSRSTDSRCFKSCYKEPKPSTQLVQCRGRDFSLMERLKHNRLAIRWKMGLRKFVTNLCMS